VFVTVVQYAALGMSVVSFIAFLVLTFRRHTAAAAGGAGVVERQSGLEDLAKVTEALSKLADSLAKAGPSIAALVASIFFMMVALIAGAIGPK
jgi:hypothetical protein